MPNLLALRPTRRPGRQPRSGFALIISLSLMTLLLLLVLTLSILVRLELQTAQGSLYTEQARQNALLAAYVGIGQLQKFAGPDQRITTTADIGRQRDRLDLTTSQIGPDSRNIGMIFPYVTSTPEGAFQNIPPLYGFPSFTTGGTTYWTLVWGHGTTPLSIYTGQDANGHVSPSAVLLNYMISGDEGTPLTFSANGVVTPPDKIVFTSTTGDSQTGIRLSNPSGPANPNNWTALTTGIQIKPTAGNSTSYAPAALLVGPGTALTNANFTTGSFVLHPGNDPSKPSIRDVRPGINQVIVPLVNINIPDETATRTVGRYAFWVGDEGVKAKYNLPDPYAGADKKGTITDSSQAAQAIRYRYGTVQRNGMERMAANETAQMNTYSSGNTAGVNNPSFYNATAAAQLNAVLDQPQVQLIDRQVIGFQNKDDSSEVLRLHFHDYTTYSYGVVADTLRGGLRYDLTAAFEPGPASDAVFTGDGANNTLKGRAILPPSVGAPASLTTEPGAGNLSLKNRADSSAFHGPAAPDFGNTTHPGLKWDVLQSWYRISANNTGATPVQIQPGNSTTASVSPVILQARLKFGETVDNQQFQYVAVEPIFVLANPYNYPITPPAGGLDLGFRINTATGWEWGFHAIARNSDRTNPHGSGVGVYLGFDNTQNTTLATAFTASGGQNALTNGYNGAYFYSSTAISQITPAVSGITYGGGSGGFGVRPGYYPFLKNPASYNLFISSMPGSAGAQGNSRYNSVLDQVAFHIPKFINGQQIIWQPGEAIVFTLADETSGGRNLTSQFQPLSRYNQLSTTQRKITAVVGTTGATTGLYSLQVNQVTPVPLKPGTISDNVHYFMLRYTGIKTAGDTLLSYASTDGKTVPTSWNLRGNPSNTTAYGNDPQNSWPDPSFGYISTAWPSVAATLELRSDGNTAPYTGSPSIASDGGTLPFLANVTTTAYSTGISPGGGSTPMAAPGTNVLQSITNFDLSGAGIAGHTYVPGVGDPAGYLPPNPPQGYRRQFLGSGGGTTVPTLANGVLPVFLTSYVMSMALPGSMDPLYFAKDAAPTADAGSSTFDPNMQVSYRTYMDFNIRAVNLSLPPTAPLNPATTNPSQTVNTAAFITAPPFGRIWNQGPAIGGGAGDDVVQASFNPLDDTSFNTRDASPNFSTFNTSARFSGNFYNAPWGVSLSAATVGNGTTGTYSGQQYNILFALPMRFNAGTGGSQANIPNPNNPNTLMPDIPIMSLGQLQHADVTADDVWVSVGYQRANAIGNSYWTPFVNRNSSMQMKPNQSGLVTKRITSVSGNTTNFGNINNAASLGVYDISYLLNCALFDRYFFSTLAQFQSATTTPANARLKYAAGIIPSTGSNGLGLGSTAITVIDPVTGGTMFRAYAPARYMMIDGAFNVNSTSFEAWRAVLSGMRQVALLRYGGTVDGNGNPSGSGQFPVVYTPRALPSSFLSNATTNSPSSYMNGLFVYQPIKAGQASVNFSHDSSEPTGKDAASYAGFRQLTDADIDYLAMKIIQQVRARGPFLSLAQFVNRRLTLPTSGHPQPYNDPLSWSGALQTAIDLNTNTGSANNNSLNNFYLAMINNGSNPTSPLAINSSLLPADSKNGASTNQTYPEGPTQFGQSPYPSGSADPNSRLVGIPGWLTQADLLEALAPILSVRSDTFIVRTYGEVISPQTSQHEADLEVAIAQDPSRILGRAWCEVVVQRVPDYIATDTASLNEPSATTGLNAPNPSIGGKVSPILSPVNIAFGRRFKIVSVRWLNASDI